MTGICDDLDALDEILVETNPPPEPPVTIARRCPGCDRIWRVTAPKAAQLEVVALTCSCGLVSPWSKCLEASPE